MRRTTPLYLTLRIAGSVIDLGATGVSRRPSRAHEKLVRGLRERSVAEQVAADWNVVAEEFNRVARGEGRAPK